MKLPDIKRKLIPGIVYIYDENTEEEEEIECMKHHWLTENTCGICYEKYKPGDIAIFARNKACEHHYHEKCIKKWLGKKLSKNVQHAPIHTAEYGGEMIAKLSYLKKNINTENENSKN